MSQPSNISLRAINYDHTLVLAIELSNKSWVLAAQVPGLPQTKAQRTIEPNKNALLAAIDGYRARAAAVGYAVERVITTYEAGWSGFWLARWLVAQGVEVHVVQPSSVPVDRRLRRAKSDGIDAELLLRTLLAWLRGEPRVCSMVPIPDEADEDARRCVRERTELLSDRVGLTNRIGAVLATLGVNDYNPLLQSRRRRLAELRTGLDEPIPPNALAKIERLLARLELVLAQIAELERERDEVAAADAPDRAGKMIQQLTQPARHRRAKRNRAGSRGLCTTLSQWQGARLICRPYFDSVQQRRNQPRAGHWEGRQPPAQNGDGRVGMALATLPTGRRAGGLVPRSRWLNRPPYSQGYGGGSRTQATDRSMAICH